MIVKMKNCQLTEAIENYLHKRIAALEKFSKDLDSELITIEVELGRTTQHHRTGDIFRAEINFSAGKIFLRAEAEKEDLYAAIDEAKDDLAREIKKFKTKKETIFLRGARSLKKRYGISPLARFRKK